MTTTYTATFRQKKWHALQLADNAYLWLRKARTTQHKRFCQENETLTQFVEGLVSRAVDGGQVAADPSVFLQYTVDLPLSEFEALLAYMCELTSYCEGMEDHGGDPLAWDDLSEEDRLALWEDLGEMLVLLHFFTYHLSLKSNNPVKPGAMLREPTTPTIDQETEGSKDG